MRAFILAAAVILMVFFGYLVTLWYIRSNKILEFEQQQRRK